MSRRVVLLACGSLGDVAPHVALACELQRRGHDVQLLTLNEFTHLGEKAGVPTASLGVALYDHPLFQNPRLRKAMATNTVFASALLDRWARKHASAMATGIDEQVRAGDLVLSGVMTLDSAYALQQAGRCDAVHVTFAATLPTAHGESYVIPPRTHGVHRSNWVVTRYVQWTSSLGWSRRAGRVLRERLGLPREGAAAGAAAMLALPTLVGATPLLAPPAPDWPERAVVTGAWVKPSDPEPDSLPSGLTGFVEAGPAPVYLGFGSMPTEDAADDLRRFAEVARRSGQRLVVRPSPLLDSSGVEIPDGVFVVQDVPHEWLFPRMAAVIHHGGAGTCTAGLRAAVPTGVVAHTMDQPHNGRRLHAAGVGPAPLSSRRLTTDRLADMVTALTVGPDADAYRTRAAELGAQVRAEDGTGTAIDSLGAFGLLT